MILHTNVEATGKISNNGGLFDGGHIIAGNLSKTLN